MSKHSIDWTQIGASRNAAVQSGASDDSSHTSATKQDEVERRLDLAEQIRQACITAARSSYEDAAANGLCAEGAWECAVDAMRHLDLVVQLQDFDVQNSKR